MAPLTERRRARSTPERGLHFARSLTPSDPRDFVKVDGQSVEICVRDRLSPDREVERARSSRPTCCGPGDSIDGREQRIATLWLHAVDAQHHLSLADLWKEPNGRARHLFRPEANSEAQEQRLAHRASVYPAGSVSASSPERG